MSPLADQWIPFLRKIFFFSSFTEEELARLLDKMLLLSLPKGAVVFRQSDPGDALYLINSGRVRLVQTENGQEKTVAYLGRGEVVGEMTLLTGEPRPNTAVVDATVELLVLYKKDFDPLLREMPTMAVQIARLLTARLMEATRERSTGAPASKILPILTHLSLSDKAVFIVNLALSLVDQTRRRVLLLDILDHESGIFTKSLGLEPVRVGENSLRLEDLQIPHVVRRLTSFHPSGLELMSLPLSLLDGKLFSAIYPFLDVLRQDYDFTLVVLPPAMSRAGRAILEESDRVLFIEKDSTLPGQAEFFQSLTDLLPPEKISRIQLLESMSPLTSSAVNFRIPWRSTLGKELSESRTLFLPANAIHTQRLLDRLTRHIGGVRIGLAMGSGAAFGYSIIGMLRVLERNGVFPDVLAGTSMGALIGSFYALGKTPDELEEIALTITKKKLWSLADLTLPWQGLILGRQVLKFLKSILGDVTFEELSTPFACVATDIVTGEEVILNQGNVAEAVRGSLSLPFFFQPFFHNGRFLVDGGLVNPVPTSVIASMGADILLSVNLTTKPSQKRFPGRRNRRRESSSFWKGPNILEVLFKTIYTMQFGIAQSRTEPAHVVMAPDLSNYTWAEFHRASDLIKLGEAYTEESLPKIKSLLPFFADYCRVPLRRPVPLRAY
jgi:NTE family protein